MTAPADDRPLARENYVVGWAGVGAVVGGLVAGPVGIGCGLVVGGAAAAVRIVLRSRRGH